MNKREHNGIKRGFEAHNKVWILNDKEDAELHCPYSNNKGGYQVLWLRGWEMFQPGPLDEAGKQIILEEDKRCMAALEEAANMPASTYLDL